MAKTCLGEPHLRLQNHSRAILRRNYAHRRLIRFCAADLLDSSCLHCFWRHPFSPYAESLHSASLPLSRYPSQQFAYASQLRRLSGVLTFRAPRKEFSSVSGANQCRQPFFHSPSSHVHMAFYYDMLPNPTVSAIKLNMEFILRSYARIGITQTAYYLLV